MVEFQPATYANPMRTFVDKVGLLPYGARLDDVILAIYIPTDDSDAAIKRAGEIHREVSAKMPWPEPRGKYYDEELHTVIGTYNGQLSRGCCRWAYAYEHYGDNIGCAN